MKPEIVLQALLAVWDELPTLVGRDWPGLLPKLAALTDQVQVTGDPDITTELVLTLRPYAAAWARLFATIQELTSAEDAEGDQDARPDELRPTFDLNPTKTVTRTSRQPRIVTRGGRRQDSVTPTPTAGPSLESLADQLSSRIVTAQDESRQPPLADADHAASGEMTATCHVRAEMDRELVLDHVTTLEVSVSREAIEGALHEAAAEAAITVDVGRRLIIQVLPKANLQVVGESRAEIDIPASGEAQTAYFDLRPTDHGRAEIWVVLRQGQIPLTTLKLNADVESTARQGFSIRSTAESDAAGTPLDAEPLHQLRISQVQRGGNLQYEYELEAPGLGILDRFESRPVTADPQQYVSALFKRIEERWLSTNSDVEEFTQELREFGGELLEQLIPEKLQDVLWQNRRRLTSIQVLATEPFIPWELVHLREPSRPLPTETVFLGQMGLVRWLYDSGWPPHLLRIRPGRAYYLIPDYPDERYALPEAGAERQFLEQAFAATAVEPQPTPVRNLLSEKGSFDLLHFAGHGAAEAGTITEARLLLQGRIEDGRYVEASLTTTTVTNRSDLRDAEGSRPIVVLNACQAGRLGYRLTGIGGFAQAFLHGGAGAFVGTQWSVGDAPARVFTETLYRQLLRGVTVAEATVAARERARADGDATWLAYAVYAHPNARLGIRSA